MKSPEKCSSLNDVRCGIDAIDKEIFALFGKRLGYVLAAAQFKPTEASIAAPDGVSDMLIERTRWATMYGLPPHFVNDIYLPVIRWYISEQTTFWKQKYGLQEKTK